jgi:isopentenyl diphosphate isomerase/L-lactate dehydrogenase-like FMN-dependent dehydrogenase
VERVLDLLNRELAICMRGSGVTSVRKVAGSYVQDLGQRQPDLISQDLR